MRSPDERDEGTPGGPVVVGVDGSPQALRAVRLAAEQAAGRDLPLRVVHAFVWPLVRAPLGRPAGAPPGAGLRAQAEATLADAVAEARVAVPGLPVDGRVLDGQAVPVLVGAARGAALVVVGHRGLGGFASLVLGSVATQLAAHADCPVLVARGQDRAGPVVVGVDGSELSAPAVRFAAAQAARGGDPLHVVHAARGPAGAVGDQLASPGYAAGWPDGHQRALAGPLAAVADAFPGLPVTRRIARGRPAAVLVEESERARLLVVGALGRGNLAGLLLGSVSQAVLQHARCPVAVVRRGTTAGVADRTGNVARHGG